MGKGASPAAEKAVVFPSRRDIVSVDGAKIPKIHKLETRPDAGEARFIKALGEDMG